MNRKEENREGILLRSRRIAFRVLDNVTPLVVCLPTDLVQRHSQWSHVMLQSPAFMEENIS
jgi:hypothetical protein